jgi:putative selenium metabolism protein SsnA
MIIKNAVIVTCGIPNQIISDASLIIENGIVTNFGSEIEVPPSLEGQEIIDAKSQIVLPGNICAHTHFYGAFSRGMAIVGPPSQEFQEILSKLWWPLDRALDLDDVYYSALVCIIDSIRHGTTTLFDHHASQKNTSGSLDAIERAVKETGIRADLCYEVSDREGKSASRKGILENLRFIEKCQKEKNSFLNAHFGLHASMTLSEATMAACRESTPNNIGFHIHVAEAASDEYDSLDKYGIRIVDRLEKYSILNEKTIIAHGVHLDYCEMELLVKHKCWLTTQPRSNMNNAVGIPSLESMMGIGIPICLGNDGFTNDMWEEWKACYFSQKLWNRDPRKMPADKIAQIAWNNNSDLATQSFNIGRIGRIEKGAQADLIFVDYKPFTELTSMNLPWHIIFGLNESMITSTMVAGKFLMKNRVLTTIDEEKVVSIARQRSQKVWKKYQDIMSSNLENG